MIRARPGGRIRVGCAAAWLGTLLLAAHAFAIVVDDGAGNTEPPADVAGWDNVGRVLGGPSVLYMGDRWVLTAHHVGAGIVEIAGERYDPLADSLHRIRNDDGSPSDLLLFRIAEDPGLPPLPLARSSPRVGEDVILVGSGASRGSRVTVDSPIEGLIDGWYWGPGGTKRWGTNLVSGRKLRVPHADSYTIAVPLVFDSIDDPDGTRQEAAAADGDSGGALFSAADAFAPEQGLVLSGVLFSVTSSRAQPPRTSLYGNITYAADVASYRSQLMDVMGRCGAGPDDCGSGDAEKTPPAARERSSGVIVLLVVLAGVLAWRTVALARAASAER